MDSHASLTGVITGITPEGYGSQYGCSQLLSLQTDHGPANAVIGPATYVLNSYPLSAGQTVTVFYDSGAPMPLIYPPRYQALAAAPLRNGQTAALDYFDENLENPAHTLRLGIAASTVAVTPNGQYFAGPLENRPLLAVYSASTKSIPAMAYPEQLVAFCAGE